LIPDCSSGFQPDAQLRTVVLATLRQAAVQANGDAFRRRDLDGQLERLRDLYVMGDVTKDEYTWRRQSLEEELERIGPPLDPELDRAEAVLGDFSKFWDAEPKPAERRRLIASLFDRVWRTRGRSSPSGRASRSCATSRPSRIWPKPGGAEAGFNSGSDGTGTRDLRRDRVTDGTRARGGERRVRR
jgi:hypothetical protein